MRLNDIKDYGFYQEIEQPTVIYEALKDEDNGKEVLSLMIWHEFDIKDGIKFYETDMVALNPENDEFFDIEVKKVDKKFKIVDDNDKYYSQYGASSVMYEDKLSNTEKLTKIKKLCIKESKGMTFSETPLGDKLLEQTDRGKLAEKILRIIYE